MLFVPLSRALMQVRNETVARAAIREAVGKLASRDAIVSEVIDLAPDRIRVRLILTDAVPAAKVEGARKAILKRTGRDVELFVRKVAGEEELALLRERLKPAPPTPLEDLDGVRRELVARLEQPLHEAWPAGSATLLGYELGFSPSGIVVRLRYQAPTALEEAAAGSRAAKGFPEPPPRRAVARRNGLGPAGGASAACEEAEGSEECWRPLRSWTSTLVVSASAKVLESCSSDSICREASA